MTTRERWIVYPLLFLALGTALRDKLLRATTTDSISCREMVLVDETGEPLLRLAGKSGRTAAAAAEKPLPQLEVAGLLSVVDGEGRPLLALGRDQQAGGGMIATFSPEGRVAAMLRSDSEEVRLDLVDPRGGLSLMLGHSEGKSGLFAVGKSGRTAPLSPVISSSQANIQDKGQEQEDENSGGRKSADDETD